MALKVPFKNPMTGEIRSVKVGWSWTLFLWSGIFGIPLFIRGLIAWGAVFIAFNFLNFVTGNLDLASRFAIAIIAVVVETGLLIFLGVKGNEITAKRYLDQGWDFVEPDSDLAKYAKGRWGILQGYGLQQQAVPERTVRF